MLLFLDEAHKQFFYSAIKTRCISPSDNERIAFFYVIGLMETTRYHIKSLYDDTFGGIILESLDLPFQTSGSCALTKLAFNLFNGFETDHDSVLDIICPLDQALIPYIFVAMKLRLGMLHI